jgi:hypothetical protein
MSNVPKGNGLREYGETAEQFAIELLEQYELKAVKKQGSHGKPDLFCLLHGVPCHIEVKRMRLWYYQKGVGKRFNHLNVSSRQLETMIEMNKKAFAFFLIFLEFPKLKQDSILVPLILMPEDVKTSSSHVTKGTTYYSMGISHLLSNAFPLKFLKDILKPSTEKIGQKTLMDFKRKEDKTDFEDEWDTIEKNALVEDSMGVD